MRDEGLNGGIRRRVNDGGNARVKFRISLEKRRWRAGPAGKKTAGKRREQFADVWQSVTPLITIGSHAATREHCVFKHYVQRQSSMSRYASIGCLRSRS